MPVTGFPRTLWWYRAGRDDAGPPAIVPAPTVTQQIVCAETVAGGATTIKVNVLNATIPSGTLLTWSGGTQATLTATAPAYASSIAVNALPTGISAGETASASVNTVNVRRVSLTMPAPTLVDGRPT